MCYNMSLFDSYLDLIKPSLAFNKLLYNRRRYFNDTNCFSDLDLFLHIAFCRYVLG